MDIKAEFEKFLKRFTDINDKPVLWFSVTVAFFAGTLFANLLPAIILLSIVLLIIGTVWVFVNKEDKP